MLYGFWMVLEFHLPWEIWESIRSSCVFDTVSYFTSAKSSWINSLDSTWSNIWNHFPMIFSLIFPLYDYHILSYHHYSPMIFPNPIMNQVDLLPVRTHCGSRFEFSGSITWSCGLPSEFLESCTDSTAAATPQQFWSQSWLGWAKKSLNCPWLIIWRRWRWESPESFRGLPTKSSLVAGATIISSKNIKKLASWIIGWTWGRRQKRCCPSWFMSSGAQSSQRFQWCEHGGGLSIGEAEERPWWCTDSMLALELFSHVFSRRYQGYRKHSQESRCSLF